MSSAERPLSMIVAVSRNGAIGRQGGLPWKLPADLLRFRNLTWGHHLIMGRKTFAAINRLLPGRTTVVLTRRRDWIARGAVIVHSVSDALRAVASDPQPFVVGGAEIYQLLLPWIGRMYVTRVETEIEGDTFLPPIAWKEWTIVGEEFRPADDRNAFDITFVDYVHNELVRSTPPREHTA